MIHMLQNLNDVNFLIGTTENIRKIKLIPARKVFDSRVVDFLSDLASFLLKDQFAKKYQDIIAFAFWIRKSSLKKVAEIYEKETRIGRGTVFHIAPSNIPVQFAVSLVYALVAGNASIIRISDKEFEQVDILCKAINDLVQDKYKILAPYINVIRYGHNDDITSDLSSICDARIIWGGDNTINYIGRVPIPPRSVELKFADRFSVMIINADEYLQMDSKSVARDFYMDTFSVDQNACSSPRIIIWTGDNIKEARDIFWNSIQEGVEDKYEYKDIYGTEKLLKFTLLAARDKDIRLIKKDNKIVRVTVKRLYPELFEYKGNCGYFFEYETKKLDDILPIITKECQTIVCCGIDKGLVRRMIIEMGVCGGDRVVDVGHALDLSFFWDGYDMVRELSRIIL